MQPAALCGAFYPQSAIPAAAQGGQEWILGDRILGAAAIKDGLVQNLERSFEDRAPPIWIPPCISLHQEQVAPKGENLLIRTRHQRCHKSWCLEFNGWCSRRIQHLPLPLSRNPARANKRLCKYLHFAPNHPNPSPPSLLCHSNCTHL